MLNIFLVTVRFYDGGSDDDGRSVASVESFEQCARNADAAEIIVSSRFEAEREGEILNVEVEPTFDLAYGNGNASCVS